MTVRKKFLIICPNWIGDMVMTHALLQKLKHIHPYCIIDIIAPTWCAELAQFMPEIRKIYISPSKHGQLNILKVWNTAKKLQKKNYSHAIIIPNSFKSALIPFLAKIPIRIGYIGEWRQFLLTKHYKKNKKQKFVDQVAMLFKEEALDTPPPYLHVNQNALATIKQKYNLPNSLKKTIALCPGAAYGPAKSWPIEYYLKIAQHMLQKGWHVWLFGSQAEEKLGQYIEHQCKESKNFINFIGKTTLEESIYLLSCTEKVMANDSGLLHIASALQRHVIALYGPTPPDVAPPLTKKADIYYLKLDCSPCFQRHCPLKHHQCLRQITPEMVLQNLESGE